MATTKQKQVTKILVEKGGKISVSRAMRKAGYSPKTAKTPKKLTQSKGWQELLDTYLPEDLLTKKHQELISVPIRRKIYKKGDLEVETEELNVEGVARGLHMAYMLRGKYKPQQVEVRTFTSWTPQELDDYAKHGTIPKRFTDAS